MNPRPAFAPPNPEVEETVDVPAQGTYVVEDGDVHEARELPGPGTFELVIAP